MSAPDRTDILTTIIKAIREAIDEDWIMEHEIRADTRLSGDLEIESIEFVTIAESLRQRFGEHIDMIGWLAGKDIHQLINLTPGDLADFVHEGMLRQLMLV